MKNKPDGICLYCGKDFFFKSKRKQFCDTNCRNSFIYQKIERKPVKGFNEGQREFISEFFLKKGVSKAESRVCPYVLAGHSYKKVGEMLKLGEKTIKFHLHNIFRKLKIENRLQLVWEMDFLKIPSLTPEEDIAPKKVKKKEEPKDKILLPRGKTNKGG